MIKELELAVMVLNLFLNTKSSSSFEFYAVK